MPTTTLLHAGRHYDACVLRDGSLVVTRKRGGGVRLTAPAADTGVEAIRTAIDADEAAALCRAVINA